MKLKITKIGGSNYIIVPHEFVKVYGIENAVYKLEFLNKGKTLIYRQVVDVENLSEEENIPQEKIDEVLAAVAEEEKEEEKILVTA